MEERRRSGSLFRLRSDGVHYYEQGLYEYE
jgi:hypothetical protein